jgi:hypothetical protein
MTMNKTSPISMRFTLMNKGVVPPAPVSEQLVNDMSLDLMSTADGISVKNIKVGDCVTFEGNGTFSLLIPSADVDKLPKSGNAMLKGKLLPCERGFIIHLGRIIEI